MMGLIGAIFINFQTVGKLERTYQLGFGPSPWWQFWIADTPADPSPCTYLPSYLQSAPRCGSNHSRIGVMPITPSLHSRIQHPFFSHKRVIQVSIVITSKNSNNLNTVMEKRYSFVLGCLHLKFWWRPTPVEVPPVRNRCWVVQDRTWPRLSHPSRKKIIQWRVRVAVCHSTTHSFQLLKTELCRWLAP